MKRKLTLSGIPLEIEVELADEREGFWRITNAVVQPDSIDLAELKEVISNSEEELEEVPALTKEEIEECLKEGRQMADEVADALAGVTGRRDRLRYR